MTLKVAIVGCGKIADGHVETIRRMPDLARIVGVCDREPLMAEQLATRYGLDFHTSDVERLVGERRPDVLHVTTPPGSHSALAKFALDAGCHVYVEKPLTPSLRETRALVAHAESVGRKLTVGYTYFLDPATLELRALLQGGALGDVVHLESFYGYDLAGSYGAAILADPSHWVFGLPGQLLHNNLDHLLYKLLEHLDEDDPQMHARGFVRRSTRYGDPRDSMVDELRLSVIGQRTTAYVTFTSHVRPAAHFLRVYGTRNIAHVDYVGRTVALEASRSLPSAVGRLAPPFTMAATLARAGVKNVGRFAKSDFHFFAGMEALLRAFYASILEGGPPPILHRDIVRVAAMLEEIFRQIGRPSA
jgi:predicted dehydrogenase